MFSAGLSWSSGSGHLSVFGFGDSAQKRLPVPTVSRPLRQVWPRRRALACHVPAGYRPVLVWPQVAQIQYLHQPLSRPPRRTAVRSSMSPPGLVRRPALQTYKSATSTVGSDRLLPLER